MGLRPEDRIIDENVQLGVRWPKAYGQIAWNFSSSQKGKLLLRSEKHSPSQKARSGASFV